MTTTDQPDYTAAAAKKRAYRGRIHRGITEGMTDEERADYQRGLIAHASRPSGEDIRREKTARALADAIAKALAPLLQQLGDRVTAAIRETRP